MERKQNVKMELVNQPDAVRMPLQKISEYVRSKDELYDALYSEGKFAS